MHLISGGNFVVLTPNIHWRFDKRWKDYYKIGGHVVHVHFSNFKEGQQLAHQQGMNPWMQFCNFVSLCLFFTIFVSIILLFRLCCFFFLVSEIQMHLWLFFFMCFWVFLWLIHYFANVFKYVMHHTRIDHSV